MSLWNKSLGQYGEDTALAAALEKGYTLLERNYRSPLGEIDLILQAPNGEIVFAEVKARTNLKRGYPELAVNRTKLQHIIKTACFYLDSKYSNHYPPSRIDVIALLFDRKGENLVDLKWYEHVGTN